MSESNNKTSPTPLKSAWQRLDWSQSAGKLAGQKPPFSQRAWDGLKTLLWVGPLTALIWIYAEREQLATQNDVPVRFEIRSTAADRIVTLLSPADRYISLDLEGSRASLDNVRDQLSEARRPVELIVGEDPGYEGYVSVTDKISNNEIFTRNAVTVVRARPSVRVRVEAKGTRSMPVLSRPEDRNIGQPVFDPPSVTVEGPRDLLANLPAEQAVVYADLSRFAAKTPGTYEETVSLSMSVAHENITLPRSVKARIEIQASAAYTIPSIPVLLALPSRNLAADRFKIQTDATLANVEITGPPEAILQIKEGKFLPAVTVELSPADFTSIAEKSFERVIKIKSENYRLPKLVAVVNPDREMTVRFISREQ